MGREIFYFLPSFSIDVCPFLYWNFFGWWGGEGGGEWGEEAGVVNRTSIGSLLLVDLKNLSKNDPSA